MSSEKKFSRITVTTDDEDDVIIHAGVRFAAPAVEEEYVEDIEAEGVESAEASCAEGPAPAVPAAAVATLEAAPEAPAAPAAAPAVESDSAAAPSRKGKPAGDDYYETTLEDLEVGKMSGMQKGIIIAAVVLIAVFVVYLLI